MNNKSDNEDGLVELKDQLLLNFMGNRFPIVDYNNIETKQLASMKPAEIVGFDPLHPPASTTPTPGVTTTDLNSKVLKYKNLLNVYARLQKRGEHFIGDMEHSDKIEYVFEDSRSTNAVKPIIHNVTFEAGSNQHTPHRYKIQTNETNDKIIFSTEGEMTMKVDNKVVTSYEVDKNKLFPGGNAPSVEIVFTNNENFKIEVQNGIANPIELLRLEYYSHVGYAYQRGIDAGEAVYKYLQHEIDELKALIKHHHP